MKIIKLIILSTLAIATMNCSDEPSHKLPDSPSPVKSKLISDHGIWDLPGSAENSLTAYRLAFEDTWFAGTKVDLQQTSDGKFAIYHYTEINGKQIIDMTLEEVQSYKLVNGEKIPSLTDVLELHIKYHNKILLLDLKTAEISDILNAVSDYQYKDKLFYTAWSSEKCRMLAKEGASSVFIRTTDINNVEIDFCLDWNISGISVSSQSLDEYPQSVESFHSSGLKYIVWYPSAYDDIIKYINMGVDYVITDWVPYHK